MRWSRRATEWLTLARAITPGAALAVTIAAGAGLPLLAGAAAPFAGRLFGLSIRPGFNLPYLYVQHGLGLALALALIGIARRVVPADYGLHWPRGKTYIPQAAAWGAAFAVIMTLVGFAPEILAGHAPLLDYKLTPANVSGWLFFEGIYVGPTEEIPFRALLVTFLAAAAPGRVRLGRYEMNQAGVTVAIIFALTHVTSFWTTWWPLALGQQVYAFALGVLYAYWLEKSGSVVAPIVGHNVGDGLAYVIMYLWIWLAA
jgi:hypothetical protein